MKEQEEEDEMEHVETAEEKEARINAIGGEIYWHRDKYYINLKEHCGLWYFWKTKKGLKKKKHRRFVVYNKIRWDPVTQAPNFNDLAFTT